MALINVSKEEIEVPKEQEDSETDTDTEVLDIKKALIQIQENPPLFEYYDGFLYTLTRAYDTARAVDSDLF